MVVFKTTLAQGLCSNSVIVNRRWPGARFFKFSVDHCQVALVKAKKEVSGNLDITDIRTWLIYY